MRLFKRLEKRAAAPYTDAIVDAIQQAAAGGPTATVTQVGALEVAAGYWQRAMASAVVMPATAATAAVTPAVLGIIGRELCRRGEAVFQIGIDAGGGVKLTPAAAWDIRGGPDESGWLYRLDLFGPSGNRTVMSESAGVVHVRYAVDPARPHCGLSPVSWARATGRLAANIEQALSDETGAPVGNLLPMPHDGGSEGYEQLRKDISNLRGKVAFVETVAAGHGDGRAAAPMGDWTQKRIGGDPPPVLNELRDAAGVTILSVCGLPPPIAAGAGADGTSRREAFRQFLHATVAPVARGVELELAMKLDAPDLRLNFDALYAADLSGRARAFGSMVKGGMSADKAAALAGLLTDDEG